MTQIGTAYVKIETDETGLDKGFASVKQKSGALGGAMSTALGTATGFAAAQIGLQGLGGAFDFLIGGAAGFEKSLGAVKAATGATSEEMEGMRALSLKIGADTSKSASEAVLAMGELAKAGMPVETILNGAGLAAVQFAEATGIDVPNAAVLMSNAMNIFSADGRSAAETADLFTRAAGASAIGVEDLGQAMASGGSAAVAAGLSMDDFAHVVGLMGNNGVKGAEAGTGLKSMLNGLTPVTDKAKDAMAEMGFSAFDANGNMKDLRTIVGEYADATKNMTQEQKMATGELLFGSYGVSTMNTLVKEGVGGWDEFTDAMGKAPSVAEQSTMRMAGLAGQWEIFKGSLETLSINIGTLLLPALISILQPIIQLTNLLAMGVVPAANLLAIAFGAIGSAIGLIPNDVLIALGLALAVLAAPSIAMAIGALAVVIGIYTVNMIAAGVATIVALAPWIALTAAIAAVIFVIIQAIKHWDEIKAAVSSAAAAVQGAVTGAFNAVKGVVESVMSAITGFIEDHWRMIVLVILGPLGLIVLAVEHNWGAIRDFISGVLDAILGVITSVFGTITGVITGAVSEWLSVATARVQAIYDFVSGLFNALIGAVEGPMGEIVDRVERGWNDAKDRAVSIVTGLVDAVESILRTIIEKARSIGREAGNALLDGLKSIPGVGAALDAAGAIGSGFESAKGFFGFATGGFAQAHMPHLVGELGPELWVPEESGHIIPNKDLGDYAQQGGITVMLPDATIYARDKDDAERSAGDIGWGISLAARARGVV